MSKEKGPKESAKSTSEEIWKISRYVYLVVIIFIIVSSIYDLSRGLPFEQGITIAYTPELLATMVGVLLALLLERYIIAHGYEQRIPELTQLIVDELRRLTIALETERPVPLTRQAWESLVNAGESRLFSSEVQTRLHVIYSYATELDVLHEMERTIVLDVEHLGSHLDIVEENRLKGERLLKIIRDTLENESLCCRNGVEGK